MRSLASIRFLLIAVAMLAFSPASFAQIGVAVSVGFAPPELPVYEQPLCPGDGYIWTPGYWAWDGSDYYWVPGTWVLAPEVGYFWTPPYWGWGGSAFLFHEGYWGPRVGFYGGINYGFGYYGHGFAGGRWDNGHFFYNRAVANVNDTIIHNVYNTRVTHITENRVSYNGGQGGINDRATVEEEAAARERHVGPVPAQTQHVEQARANQELRASVNHGRPSIAATEKPGEFKSGVTRATSEGHYHNNAPSRAANSAAASRSAAIHPNELPPHEHPAAPNTGNAKLDQEYQQQQQKLYAKQEQEHQTLQQKQDQEHAKQAKQQTSAAEKQQLEQRHQQQTQQMEQKHAQEQEKMVQHQAAPHGAPSKPR
jgi:WXXGXW repeat (2 copies)